MTKFLLWWQKANSYSLVIGTMAFFVVIIVIVLGYWFKWDWTGFNEHIGPNVQQYQPSKTLWDWLQLLGILAIPAVVGWGAAWYTSQQSKASVKENRDNQRESALQTYFDRMSDLLLHEHLRKSEGEEEVRDVARTQTLIVLSRLDGKRKGNVLLFLSESGLIKSYVYTENSEQGRIVNLGAAGLYGADFSGVDLSEMYRPYLGSIDVSYAVFDNAYLTGVYLKASTFVGTRFNGATLNKADLSEVFLMFSDLSKANLRGAKLTRSSLISANLENADLTDANLTRAIVTNEQLAKAKSLEGATLVDGTKNF